MNHVGEIQNTVDAQTLEYQTAQKTKSIKAKPINQILTDESVFAKFVLDTLEGSQVVKANSMCCLGIGNDVWQQDKKKLFAKYNVTDCDPDGWMTCEPKPDVDVDATQVHEEFSVIAQWGEERMIDGKQQFVQYGQAGDYICRNPKDPSDVWIVRKSFFESTYEIK